MGVSYEQLLWLMSGNTSQQADLVEKLESAGGLASLIGPVVGLAADWTPITARPSADYTCTQQNTVLQNVTGCAAPFNAGWVYDLEVLLVYSAATAGDIKFHLTTDSSDATTEWFLDAAATNVSSADFTTVSRRYKTFASTGEAAGGVAAGTKLLGLIKGRLYVPTDGGSLQLQAAQATSDASNSIVYDETEIVLRPLRRLS